MINASQLWIGLACCTLLSLPAPPAIAATRSARPAAVSETIHRHPAGFTLACPAGWSVERGEENALLLVPGDRDPLEIYLVLADPASGITRAGDPRVAELVEASLTRLFPFLKRVGSSEPVATALGPGVRMAWEGVSPTDVAVRAEAYVVIAGDTAAELLAVGPRERLAQRSSRVRRLFASFASPQAARTVPSGRPSRDRAVKPAKAQSPLARQWQQRLSGKKLTYLSSYSSGSSGGYNSRYDLTLSADGTFVFQGNSSVSIYVEGATGSSVGQESSAGSWRIVVLGGQPVLELKAEGKKTEQYRLTSQDGKTFLNGRRFFVTEP
jgi:hypothetical protein